MLPTDAAARKRLPIYSGVIRYFPHAIAAVAELSKIGNDQHNPGLPLQWAKEKSSDEPDALARHLTDMAIDQRHRDPDGVMAAVKLAWRALANLERMHDAGVNIFAASTAVIADERCAMSNFTLSPEQNQPPMEAEAWLAERDRLLNIELAALRVASSRRNGIVKDRGALDRLDAALAYTNPPESIQVAGDVYSECPDCHGIPIKPNGPIVHAANCRIEPLFPGAADQPSAITDKTGRDCPECVTDQPEAAPSLNVCPGCGGPADNGHDRCYPPNPYCCSKCTADQQPAPQPSVCQHDICKPRSTWSASRPGHCVVCGEPWERATAQQPAAQPEAVQEPKP